MLQTESTVSSFDSTQNDSFTSCDRIDHFTANKSMMSCRLIGLRTYDVTRHVSENNFEVRTSRFRFMVYSGSSSQTGWDSPFGWSCQKKRTLKASRSEASSEGLAALEYRKMTVIQEASLPPILEGRDVVGRAKTGSGKNRRLCVGCTELSRYDQS